jgi:sulfur carrier protein ThiS adenylyltransferase
VNPLPDRDLRQRDILPPDRLAACRCTVIGVGAIGRQVALQLAAIGVPWLQLIDFDTVEPVNLAPQGFLESDLGRPKVQATANLCRQINPSLETVEINDRFRRTPAPGSNPGSNPGSASGSSSKRLGNVVFACVDRIETRRVIFETARDHGVTFFCDGRMSAEVVRILTCSPDPRIGWDHYPGTLFTEAQAFRGRGACTAKSTIFTANIAAGLMLEQFSRHLRRLPIDPDLMLNLLASELTVASLHATTTC